MLDGLGLTLADFSADLPDAYGRLQPAFQLPKREPGFVGKDVAERLGYADTSDAIKRHCKGSVIRLPLPTAGGMQQTRILT